MTSQWCFPDKMKTAKVIPTDRKCDRQFFFQFMYRSVFLLLQFSKILEEIFVNKLDAFTEKYDRVNDHQYWFWGNRSTS